jgi:hypothetical protein
MSGRRSRSADQQQRGRSGDPRGPQTDGDLRIRMIDLEHQVGNLAGRCEELSIRIGHLVNQVNVNADRSAVLMSAIGIHLGILVGPDVPQFAQPPPPPVAEMARWRCQMCYYMTHNPSTFPEHEVTCPGRYYEFIPPAPPGSPPMQGPAIWPVAEGAPPPPPGSPPPSVVGPTHATPDTWTCSTFGCRTINNNTSQGCGRCGQRRDTSNIASSSGGPEPARLAPPPPPGQPPPPFNSSAPSIATTWNCKYNGCRTINASNINSCGRCGHRRATERIAASPGGTRITTIAEEDDGELAVSVADQHEDYTWGRATVHGSPITFQPP